MAITTINDPLGDAPQQSDLTQLIINTDDSSQFNLTWKIDQPNLSGANTFHSAALFDTDGNGTADYSVFVTLNSNGTVASVTLKNLTNNTSTVLSNSIVTSTITPPLSGDTDNDRSIQVIFPKTTIPGTPTFLRVESYPSASASSVADTVECFLTGTLILTDKGELPVESLKIGDLVKTADGKMAPIKWIGRQTRHPGEIKNPLRSYPILIKAGALGVNTPSRDLYVSPDHSLLVEGILINAGALVNDISILKTEPKETFTFYHIELDHHALLIAQGTLAESYLPQKEDRLGYDNGAEYEQLYPHGSALMLWPLDYPRISSKNQVPRFVTKKLQAIAEQLEAKELSQVA